MPRAVAAAHTTPAAILNGRWTHNRKAWMTTEVFCEWLLDLNHFFHQKHKKIILLVDNCPTHKVDSVTDRLDFVKVVFLPANATSLIQPCDAGVSKVFKAAYHRHMLHKVAQLVDDPSVPVVDTSVLKKHINMLHCLQFSRAAWDSLTRHNKKTAGVRQDFL